MMNNCLILTAYKTMRTFAALDHLLNITASIDQAFSDLLSKTCRVGLSLFPLFVLKPIEAHLELNWNKLRHLQWAIRPELQRPRTDACE